DASRSRRLPSGWIGGLPRGGTLLTLDDGRRALARIENEGAPLAEAERCKGALEMLAGGVDAAVEIGKAFPISTAASTPPASISRAPLHLSASASGAPSFSMRASARRPSSKVRSVPPRGKPPIHPLGRRLDREAS